MALRFLHLLEQHIEQFAKQETSFERRSKFLIIAKIILHNGRNNDRQIKENVPFIDR